MKKYFYLTQYEESGMPDEFVMEILEKNNQGAEGESLDQLLEIIPEVKDKYNQELYNAMKGGCLNNENVDVILEAWEHLAAGKLAEALEVLGVDYDGILEKYDIIPFDAATLEEIADADLKANGINANALYWYDRIDSNCIHVFNAYGNDFEYYNDMDELLDYYFNDCIKADFIKALLELYWNWNYK